jgi:prepilin-type N-terminal cleavage/methylation domain-containing protein
MSRLRAVLRDQRGFTLTELLVVATVLGMILAGVVLIQMQGQQAYVVGSHRVEVQQNNRAALELITRELRSAQAVATVTSATDLTFVDLNGTTIRYQLSGATLNRITGGTTTPLIGGVQTLVLSYYSAWNGATNTGTTTTTPASVRLVRLHLVTWTEDYAGAGSPANQRATMESLVRLKYSVATRSHTWVTFT